MCVLIALVTSSCSVNLLSGEDLAIKEQPGYRDVHFECSALRLDSVEMNVPTFRAMVSCFNADGRLEAVNNLVKELSDTEVQAVVDVGNQYFFKNTRLLYQFNRTYRALESKGIVDEAFRQFGRVTENEEFVSAAITLLKEKYFSETSPKLLKALERLSTRVDSKDMGRVLDLALSLLDSKAFDGLQGRFRGDSPAGRELRPMLEGLLAYMRDINDPGHVNAGKKLLQAIVDDRLLETLDGLTGTTSDAFKIQVPRLGSVLNVSLERNARIMDGMTSLFHYMNRPISCFQGSKEVPSGVMHVVRELSDHNTTADASTFIKRTIGMSLVQMNGMCDYPSELGQHYPSMIELADTNAMEPAADLLKALYRYQRPGTGPNGPRPLIEMLVSILSDTGSSSGAGLFGTGENNGGIKHVMPLLAEVHDRGAIDEIFLAGLLLPDDERARLKDTLAFILEPASELGGQSIYDVLMDSVVATKPGQLYDLVHSMRRFIDRDEKIFVPALQVLRSAYYVNDVHPVLEIGRAIMADASKIRPFFDALIRISEKSQFRDALRLITQMSQDGRLRELTGVVVQIYERFAMAGISPINPVEEPPFKPNRRHNLGAADLKPFPIVRDPNVDTDPCRKLDPNVSMLDPSNPKFGAQITNLVGCLNQGGQHPAVAQAVEFLRKQKSPDGRSYFDLLIGMTGNLKFTQPEQDFLTDGLMAMIQDGRIFRLLDAVPFWLTHSYPGGDDGRSDFGPVVQPLLAMLKPVVIQGGTQLRRLEDYGAKVLRRDDLPQVIHLLDEVVGVKPTVQVAGSPAYDLARYQRWAKAYECRSNPTDAARRTEQLVQEFEGSVTSWDLVAGQTRRAWTLPEFKSGMTPIFDLMSTPHASDPNPESPKVRTLDAMLGFMRYFTLSPGQKPNRWQHYTPEHLMRWFKERANDYRPILYYYPGEKTPRVKLVNSLDRLDLSLINSDFEAPIIGTNFGLKFLAEIAEAWGDEPYEIWPDEIKRKFPGGKGVKTLAQAVQSMHDSQNDFEGLVGFPDFPDCVTQVPGEPPIKDGGGWLPFSDSMKPNLFNIAQVMPVLDENAANGGLKVLRDLFFDVYYSTPERDRQDKGSANHLNVILKSVRMGVFRQVGRAILTTPPGDFAINDLFRGVIAGSISPEMAPLVKYLIVNDVRRDLIWKVMEQIFAALDGSPQGRQTMNQTAIHLLAVGGQLNLIDPFLRTTRAVLSEHRAFLMGHAPKMRSLLTNVGASDFIRALYENPDQVAKTKLADVLRDALNDPSRGVDLMTLVKLVTLDNDANRNWDRFWNRVDALKIDPSYERLDTHELIQQAVDFMAERSGNPAAISAARRLRHFTAERLESREINALLLGLANNPNEFYQVMTALSSEIENGNVRELLELARRSFVDRH